MRFLLLLTRCTPYNAWFSYYVNTKEAISPFFEKCTFIIKQHSCFHILFSWTARLCSSLQLLCNILCGPRTKIFGVPGLESNASKTLVMVQIHNLKTDFGFSRYKPHYLDLIRAFTVLFLPVLHFMFDGVWVRSG